MRNTISTRLSIRKRGESQGHHAAIATEERFSKFRHEMVGDLVWSLGAMAAEREFYGENTNGVGGDLHSATTRVASMVGTAGMGPEPLDLRGRVPKELLEETEKKLMERFERIGMQIMNRASSGSALQGDWIAARSATRPSAGPRRRSSARRTSPRCAACATTARRSRGSPRSSCRRRSCTATRSSTCSASPTSKRP